MTVVFDKSTIAIFLNDKTYAMPVPATTAGHDFSAWTRDNHHNYKAMVGSGFRDNYLNPGGTTIYRVGLFPNAFTHEEHRELVNALVRGKFSGAINLPAATGVDGSKHGLAALIPANARIPQDLAELQTIVTPLQQLHGLQSQFALCKDGYSLPMGRVDLGSPRAYFRSDPVAPADGHHLFLPQMPYLSSTGGICARTLTRSC